jgi:hypothetical protein
MTEPYVVGINSTFSRLASARAPIDGTGAFQIEQLLPPDDGAEARTLEIGERRQLPLGGIGFLGNTARDDAHLDLLSELSSWVAGGSCGLQLICREGVGR